MPSQISVLLTSMLAAAAAVASPVSPSSPLSIRDGGGFNPNCPKQSAGTCVFMMSYSQAAADDDARYECGIYDYTCTGITDFGDCDPGTVLHGNGLTHDLTVTTRGGNGSTMDADITEGDTGLSYNGGSSGVTRRDCSSGLGS